MPSLPHLAVPCLIGALAVAPPALADSRVDLGFARLTLDERYAEGGSVVTVPGNDVYRLSWQQDWSPTWGTTLQVDRWGTYMVADGAIAGSLHARTETWAALSLDRRLEVGPTRHRIGVGYQGRLVQVANSFAAPTPMYLFSELQVFHGPAVRDRLVWPLVGGFALAANLAAMPYAFSILGPGVPALGPMYWVSGDLGLEYGFKHGHVRFSYRYEGLRRYSGAFQDVSGPTFSLGAHY